MERQAHGIAERVPDGADFLHECDELQDVSFGRWAFHVDIVANMTVSWSNGRFAEQAVQVEFTSELDTEVFDHDAEFLAVEACGDGLACTERAKHDFHGVRTLVGTTEVCGFIDGVRETARCCDHFDAGLKIGSGLDLLNRHFWTVIWI